jgi:myosin I
MADVEDKVGVPDLTLLPSLDEKSLNENLKKRFLSGKIYSTIGEVVVSINPYKNYDIYGKNYVDVYKGKYMYESPPHM